MFRLLLCLFVCLTLSVKFAAASDWVQQDKQFKYSADHIPPCGYGTDMNGPKIGFIGDSWLDYGSGRCGSAEQFFSLMTDSRAFVNASKGGAKITGTKKRDIPRQVLPGKPDILVMSGGGNDLASCGGKKSCLDKTLNKIISADASEGALLDLIEKWSHAETKIVYIFSTNLPFAPKKFKKGLASGVLDELARRLLILEQKNALFKAINLSTIANVEDRGLWTDDGFHYAPASYYFFSNAAQPFLIPNQQEIKQVEISDTSAQEDTTCSYAIDKSGVDDKSNPYKDRASIGTLIIQTADERGNQRIIFDKMEGYGKQEKIKSLTRLWFDQNKKLNGWFTPYTSKKAKHTAYVTTNGPTYRVIEKVSNYGGVYSFPDNNPKWKNNYELLIFGCGGDLAETVPSDLIEIDAIDINGQKDESHNNPIKLSLKIRLPEGSGPFPTVVILHGSGNMKDRDSLIGQHLIEQGIAWIGVYSYDSRGLKWLTYKERLIRSNVFDQISDAYRVLHFIENDPRFDENNVAVTGFSLGGLSSLMTASQSMTDRFRIGTSDFKFALNQYGPCFASPADPKPDYTVFNLWGSDDASTPEKLCLKHMSYQRELGLLSDHEFIEGAAHGWFSTSDVATISAESNFSCFVEMTASEITLKKKTYKDKDEISLMKIVQKPCKKKEAVISRRNILAEQRAVELLVNALK